MKYMHRDRILPRPLSKLLPILLEWHVVVKEVPRENPPRFLGFDEYKTCVCHIGERGHDVDNYLALKIKIQQLIDRKILNFQEPEPNVHQNPLLEHNVVNMICGEDEKVESKKDNEYGAKVKAARQGDARFDNKGCQNGEVIDTLGEDSGKYNLQVKYTPSPWAFMNEVIMPDDWAGMDNKEDPKTKTQNNEINSKEEIDEEEQKQEDIRQGDKRFICEANEQGEVIDLLGQDSGRYNFHVKYYPPPWAFKNEVIVPGGWGAMDEVPINKLILEEKEDRQEQEKKKI